MSKRMDINKKSAVDDQFYDHFRRYMTPGLPKYAQFREILIAAIKSGRWRPGDKLPTELDFVNKGPFSLGTVQRGLRLLSEEGIVVRRQGHGSFVADSRKPMEDPWHCRFLDDSGEGYLPVYSKPIDRRMIVETGPWSEHLKQSSEGVLRIDRLININDEFTVFSRFFCDPQLLKPLRKCKLEELDGENFKTRISREMHLPITTINNDMSCVAFDKEIAKHMKRKAGEEGYLIEAAAYAGRDICLYYQKLFFPRTDRKLRFTELTRINGY